MARIRPACVPLSVKLVKNARRSSGACSRVIEFAPACSPAAEKPWQQPQEDEQDRRGNADLAVGRQTADQEGRDAHQQQREDQHPLAAELVADVAHEERADRPRHVADAERGERQQGWRSPGRLLGKKILPKTSAAAVP